eukprot:COSAG01_NODE_2789_length_7076_cov_8.558120_7_plen_202_part_00
MHSRARRAQSCASVHGEGALHEKHCFFPPSILTSSATRLELPTADARRLRHLVGLPVDPLPPVSPARVSNRFLELLAPLWPVSCRVCARLNGSPPLLQQCARAACEGTRRKLALWHGFQLCPRRLAHRDEGAIQVIDLGLLLADMRARICRHFWWRRQYLGTGGADLAGCRPSPGHPQPAAPTTLLAAWPGPYRPQQRMYV